MAMRQQRRRRVVRRNPSDDRTAMDVVNHALDAFERRYRGDPYASRAVASFVKPRAPFERAMAHLVVALAEYADAHRDRYLSSVGEDPIIGEHWGVIAEGLLGLLNGELDGLDASLLEDIIRNMARSQDVGGF